MTLEIAVNGNRVVIDDDGEMRTDGPVFLPDLDRTRAWILISAIAKASDIGDDPLLESLINHRAPMSVVR